MNLPRLAQRGRRKSKDLEEQAMVEAEANARPHQVRLEIFDEYCWKQAFSTSLCSVFIMFQLN